MDGAALSTKPTQHTYGKDTSVGNPTKTGYTFAGWKVNSGSTATKDLTLGATDYTAAITLTATWTAEQYDITYSGMDGAALSTKPEKHTYGKDTEVGDPTKEGYTFAGWKVNDSTTATTSLTLGATAYTAAITLTATWTPNTYQVTLDNHGATGGDLTASQTVTYGGKYGTLPVPSRTGYTFKGWYTAEADGQGTKVDANTIVATADNHTLHARWKDETAPDKPVLQDSVTLPTDWTNAQDKIPLKLYDGVGVTELWVSIDENDSYTKIDGFTPGTASMTYDYPSVTEGNHTYRFKAVDAAGNTSTETIEIRIDVTDISEKVPLQDKEVIGRGIEACSEEVSGLVLGMYVDISMFIRIGAGDWNAITETDEPIEVVINIPEKLQSDGREFLIIRAHNGEYTIMNDLDDTPDTITVSTELFSSYAIAYAETDAQTQMQSAASAISARPSLGYAALSGWRLS